MRDWRLAKVWLLRELDENERWPQVEHLYHLALARDPDERSAFLDHACEGDNDLRREVESLLAYEAKAENSSNYPRWSSRQR